MGYVYLLHFSKPLHHANHYIGYANNLEKRLKHHKKGTGANIMKYVDDFKVCRIWKNKCKNFERKLKNQKNAKKLCPICCGEKAYRRMNDA